MGIFQSLFGKRRRPDRDRARESRSPMAAESPPDGGAEPRIRYWTYWLWRWGREAGEGGVGEDVIFEPHLVERMKSVDPDIEDLLPAILRRLAAMQNRAADELTTEFNRRTGLHVT